MMNINKALIVAKREYFMVVRKKSFWISTFLLPLFIVFVSFLSGYSSQKAQEKLDSVKEFDNDVKILIQDETGYIKDDLFETSGPFVRIENKEKGIAAVEENEAEAFFYYPKDLFTQRAPIEIYRQHQNIIENGSYNTTAESLIRQAVLTDMTLDESIAAQGYMNLKVSAYKDGVEQSEDIARFIPPIFSIVIYFMMVTFGMNYLLSSVSEEKESRMIEIILTSMDSRSLLLGKLAGLLGVIFTQMVLLTLFALIALQFGESQLPFSLDDIVIDPYQMVYAILTIILGFIVLANTMIGVGSAMPTLKEAQSFSSIFILMTMFPMYLAGMLISEPAGAMAKILSFMPITAPLILLFRNALNVMSTPEMILSILALIVQFVASMYLADKLFQIGSLEYKNKIDLKSLGSIFKKNS